MRSIGSEALECELQVGDVIACLHQNTIYTIVGEEPGIPKDGILKIFLVHSSLLGRVYRHHVPVSRVINYQFVTNGVYTGWGWKSLEENHPFS
jgi:hypothetical protein